MPVRCGIDLGTTFSAIAWFDSYNNVVDTIDLEASDGGKLLRSVVYFPGNEQDAIVGDTAWNAKRTHTDRVVDAIKRSMGMAYKTQPIDGVEYTPPQISAEILKALVRDAETYLGEEVRDVIITVPAYVGDNERAATKEAGDLAGLNVLELMPEPHAAALAFAVGKVAEIVDRYILVYDLGGGTFDVTLIHAKTESGAGNAIDLKIETLCKDGNAALGGLDWDRALAQIVGEKVMQEHGVDVWAEASDEAILMDNCEKAKRHLSRASVVSVVADAANHQVEVSGSDFEDRTSDLLLQTQLLVETVLEDAEKQGITKDMIDVMLAGGSTRMPMVKTMLESITGKPPLQHRNPELLVTTGAAYWAHLLQDLPVSVPVPQPDGTIETKDVSVRPGGLTDISSYAVGVEVLRPDGQGGYTSCNAVVIPVGAAYGDVFEKEFRTSEDNMTEIPVVLYKGDSPELSECEPLMDFRIEQLPPGRPKGRPIKVTLGYDSSGIIRGTGMDLDTGTQVEIVIDRTKS